MRILREEITDPDKPFKAPQSITIGWQEARQRFSFWFVEGHPRSHTYRIVGTGHLPPEPVKELRQSVVLPDGFHVFHLVEII